MRIRARETLSGWPFWLVIAYFGLVAVVLQLYIQNGSIRTAERYAVEVRAAHIASIASQYEQCVRSIPTLRKINGFLVGVEIVHETLLTNAIAAHAATPPRSPLYTAQAQSIIRLRRSVDLVKGVRLTVPTKRECADVRNAALAQLVAR